MSSGEAHGKGHRSRAWTLLLAFGLASCLCLALGWWFRTGAALAPAPAGAVSRTPVPAGRWGRLSPARQESIERLESLGYTGTGRQVQASGVTLFQAELAAPGLNLFTSGHGPVAILIDLDGRELHRWSLDFFQIWPDSGLDRDFEPTTWWRRAHLFENGDLLAIFEGQGILKLDRNSRLIWASRNGAHHDLEVAKNGDIWVLTREARRLPRIDPDHPILEDSVSVLNAAGELKRRFSLIEAFENSKFKSYWESSRGPKRRHPGDIFHTNSLELLDGRIAGVIPAFRDGHLLLSMRTLDTIAVVDPAVPEVVWAHRGSFIAQHDPSVLENGHLLLFDNQGPGDRSAVLELDPRTLEPIWQYRGGPDRPLCSRALGAVQRLGNGNTLITESEGGRAVEVTPRGEIVWEFFNPYRAGQDGEFIAAISEMRRLPADFPTDWVP